MAKKAVVEGVDASADTSNVQIIKCGVKSVQVYSNGDSSVRYRMKLDVSIPAIKKDYETEEYAPAEVDYIDFVPRVLIAQSINLIGGLDLMYTKKKEHSLKNENASGFGAAELQVILRNAKLEIKRTKFSAGDEYTTHDGQVLTHDYEGYNTDIVEIKVSDRVQDKLDDIADSMFNI